MFDVDGAPTSVAPAHIAVPATLPVWLTLLTSLPRCPSLKLSFLKWNYLRTNVSSAVALRGGITARALTLTPPPSPPPSAPSPADSLPSLVPVIPFLCFPLHYHTPVRAHCLLSRLSLCCSLSKSPRAAVRWGHHLEIPIWSCHCRAMNFIFFTTVSRILSRVCKALNDRLCAGLLGTTSNQT